MKTLFIKGDAFFEKTSSFLIIFVMINLVSVLTLKAQTPTDAIMMNQRQFCFALLYEHGYWDQYYEGSNLRSNETVATLYRNMVLPMIAIGLHDDVNLIVGAPFVKTHSSQPNGGKFEGANGMQDLSLNLKARLMNKQLGKGKLAILTTVGYSTPVSNYLSDYGPYSLGFGANELSLRGIVQYRLDNGFYLRADLAYLWRGTTEIERDYYYNNGSYYTNVMDVPNAWNYELALGKWFFANALKVEAVYVGLNSTSGDDIRRYNANQPTNKVEFGRVGLYTQYYFKKLKGFGLLANYSQVISGRNAGKSTILSGGITYLFDI